MQSFEPLKVAMRRIVASFVIFQLLVIFPGLRNTRSFNMSSFAGAGGSPASGYSAHQSTLSSQKINNTLSAIALRSSSDSSCTSCSCSLVLNLSSADHLLLPVVLAMLLQICDPYVLLLCIHYCFTSALVATVLLHFTLQLLFHAAQSGNKTLACTPR